MNKKEQLDLINELLNNLRYIEELQPHFSNRRRIKELEDQIKDFK